MAVVHWFGSESINDEQGDAGPGKAFGEFEDFNGSVHAA